MGFVDAVMVGRLGTVPLAGIALGATVHFTIALFGLGTVLAVGPLVSQAHGAGEHRGVARYTRQGLWLAVFLAPLMMALEWSATYWLPFLGQQPEVVAITGPYLRAIMWSLLPFLAFGVLRSWLEALNKPLPVTLIALSSVLVNVLGNYAFVYGRWGFYELGAVGAGYATTISYVYLFIALFVYAQSQRSLREYRVFDRWRWPNSKYLGELFRVGLPMGVTFSIESGFFSVTGILIGTLGAVPLAAHQIALQLASFSFMLPLSVALATTIRVGNLIGAGRPVVARHAGWLAIGMGAGVMMVSATAFALSPKPLIALFLGSELGLDTQSVVALAIELLFLAGIFQIVDGAQAVAGGALRGLKDTFWPMIIGLVSYWGVGLSIGYLLLGRLGAPGLWIGLIAGLATAALLLILRWRRLINNTVRRERV